MRLAVLSTHPIQYNVPFYRLIGSKSGIELKVFYGWRGSTELVNDPGFGRAVKWDIDLTSGYDSKFVENASPSPGTHHYKGILCPSMNTEIAKWNPDALMVYGWSWHANLKAIRHFGTRLPVLFRGDSTLLDETSWLKSIVRRLYLKRIYRRVSVALYTGTNNRKYFEAMGLCGSRLQFMPHAVDNSRFMSQEEENQRLATAWRRDNGISDSQIVILFVGKLENKKDPAILLRALGVSETLRNLSVVVYCGSGPLENELRHCCNSKHTKFLGFRNQEEMPWVYRVGDVMVLPSVGPQETWGLAINEAMAAGLAAVASTKVGAGVDLIKEDVNGFLFTAGDASQLAMKLERLAIGGKDLLQRWGEASRRSIQSWSFEEQWVGLKAALERNVGNF